MSQKKIDFHSCPSYETGSCTYSGISGIEFGWETFLTDSGVLGREIISLKAEWASPHA
jgi:hypothetical protein